MVPEIINCKGQSSLSFWAVFCLFTPLTTHKNAWRYHHFTQVYQKLWSYTTLFLIYGMWRMLLLFFILGYFLPFYPPNSPKNENFRKIIKAPVDIIILQWCTKNHDYMLYSSWGMACDRRNGYFSFWTIFCTLAARKVKIQKQNEKKNNQRYHHFTKAYQKSWSKAILFLKYGAWQI